MEESTDVQFTDPEIIGAYSLDENREFQNDMRGLKYLKLPDLSETIKFDLNDGEYKGKTGIYNILERINQMTKFIMVNSENIINNGRIDADFVCFRGGLKSMMVASYKPNTDWVLMAVKLKGTIYFITPAEPKNNGNTETTETIKDISYQYGFKFESYVLSSDPEENPKGSSEVVNENEEFCILMSRTIDDSIKIIFGIESDGVEGNKVNSLEDLKTSKLAEVKCKLKRFDHCDDKPFDNINYHTKFDWWCQSYIASIDEIQVGFRDNEGVVTAIEAFDVKEFEKDTTKNNCLKFLKNFLNQVKEKMSTVDNPEEVRCFKWDQKQRKVVEVDRKIELPNNEFLSDKYINFINDLK